MVKRVAACLFLGLWALGLAACASAPVAEAPAALPAEARARAPAHPTAAMIERAGHQDAPTLASIERALGAADVARHEGAGAILTYRSESCALVLLFTADGRNEMRLADAQARPRRDGEPLPAMDVCVAAAETRRAGS